MNSLCWRTQSLNLCPSTRLSSPTFSRGLDLLERLLLDSEDLIVGDRAVEHRKRVPIVDATGHYANLVLAVPGGGSPRATHSGSTPSGELTSPRRNNSA